MSKKLYTGISTNPIKRLRAHNEGKGAKYTRAGRPWHIVYLEKTSGKSQALRRELEIKKLARAEKIILIRASLTSQKPPPESLAHYESSRLLES